MNDIVKPLTPDGMCGWDEHNQLWLWEVVAPKDGGGKSGHIIGDPRGHKCRICQQGWVLTVESLKDQDWSREYEEWMHQSCMIRYLGLKDRDLVYGALVEAGIFFGDWVEIPNEYWPPRDPWAARPWFKAKTIVGAMDLKIGKRKHVWSISLIPRSGDAIPSVKALAEAFMDQKVTKGFNTFECMIHAHNQDDLRAYLKLFSKVLGLYKREEKPVEA